MTPVLFAAGKIIKIIIPYSTTVFVDRYHVAFLGFFKPARIKLLNFFCSGIQLYVLLSPYLCFYIMIYMCLEMLH